jgi:MoxR-like ATPase
VVPAAALMAVKSRAQRRKFAQLLVEGKITREVYERWNREAGKKKLPEHVKKKKKRKAKRKRHA